LRVVLGVAGLVLAGYFVFENRGELSGTPRVLSHAAIGLLAIGFVCEVASDLSYSLMSVALFRPGERLRCTAWFFGVTLVGIAINDTIPLGTGFSAAYTLSQLRRRAFSLRRATAIVLVSNAIAVVTLVILLLVTLSSPASPTHQVLSATDIVGLSALGILLVVAVLRIDWVVAMTLRIYRALRKRGFSSAGETEISGVRFHPGTLGLAGSFGLGNWAFDMAALFVALDAVHAQVSFVGVVSAYVLGALAANLPLTPGGLGVVEGSVTVALVAFGGAPAAMLAAVLLYRVVSFWVWIPIGWTVYFVYGRKKFDHDVQAS